MRNFLTISYLSLASASVCTLAGGTFFGMPDLNWLAVVGLIVGAVGGYDLANRPFVTVISEAVGVPIAYGRQRRSIRLMLYVIFTPLSALMFGFAGKILGGHIGLYIAGVLGALAGAFIASQIKLIKSLSDLFNS